LIQAGDHLQLPPTVKSDDPKSKRADKVKSSHKKVDRKSKQTMEEKPASLQSTKTGSIEEGKPTPHKRLQPPSSLSYTLFDRLLYQHGNKLKRTLTIQYRMNENIMRFPSFALYDDKLVAAESVKNRLLTGLPGINQDEDACKEPVIFIDSG